MLVSQIFLVLIVGIFQPLAGPLVTNDAHAEATEIAKKMLALWTSCQPLSFDSKIVIDYEGEEDSITAYIHYQSNQDRCTMKFDQEGSAEPPGDDEWPEFFLVNPEYHAQISYSNKIYTLVEIGKFKEHKEIEDPGFFRQPIQNYSACGLLLPVWELLENKNWNVESVSNETYRNEECKKVVVSALAFGEKGHIQFWVTPNGQCLKTSTEIDSQTGTTEFFYQDTTSPVAQKVVISAPGRTEIISNENIIANAVVDRDVFFLSHYGLPEPKGVTPPNTGWPAWLKILLIGLGLVISAAIFKRLRETS